MDYVCKHENTSVHPGADLPKIWGKPNFIFLGEKSGNN